MYILIELVPEADGSGLVFICILLIVLALLIGAELSMSWILAPIGLTMALMESKNWWILLLAAGIGIAANWVSAKRENESWNPALPLIITAAAAGVLVVCGIIEELTNPKGTNVWEILLILVLGIPVFGFFFYPTINALTAFTSLTTIPCGYKPFVGAFCSTGSVVSSAIALQGLVEGVLSWFGESTFLEQVMPHLDKFMVEITGLEMLDMSNVFDRLQPVVDTIASVPVWLRFFIALAVAVGCIYGKKYCADGRTLFS